MLASARSATHSCNATPSLSPSSLQAGDAITLSYSSKDAVTKALLLRASSATHSIAFDARALWLDIVSDDGSTIRLDTPSSGTVLPPGL